MKLESSWQIFEKSLNIKFHENPSSGAELFHADGQMNRLDGTNGRFLQFCECA